VSVRELVVAWVLFGLPAAAGCARPDAESAGDRVVDGPREGGGEKPSDDARGDARGGLAQRVREIAGPVDPVLPAGEGVAIPAVIPPGDVLIEHACSHSMQPFGTGYWRHTTTVDLAAATLRSSRVEGDEGTGFMATRSETRSEKQTTLMPADVARIRDALDRVLAGGPYAPVYALSEGIVCTVSLRVGDAAPFFQIDKSRPEREDAVTRLVASLGVATPP
jgi:hypothetical protein